MYTALYTKALHTKAFYIKALRKKALHIITLYTALHAEAFRIALHMALCTEAHHMEALCMESLRMELCIR